MSLQPRSDKYGSVPAALKRVIEVPADLFVNLMSPFNNDRFSAVGLATVFMHEFAYLVWSNNTCLRSQKRGYREAFDTWAICRHRNQFKNDDGFCSEVHHGSWHGGNLPSTVKPCEKWGDTLKTLSVWLMNINLVTLLTNLIWQKCMQIFY